MTNYYANNRNVNFTLFFIMLLSLIAGCSPGIPTTQPVSPSAPPPKHPQPPASSVVSEQPQQPAQPVKPVVEKPKSVLPSMLGQIGWYANDPNTLARQVDGFFQNANVPSGDDVIAIINPHAGYAYSGQTAAFGVKAAKTNYSRVIIIGPSHHVSMPDVLSVPRVTHYQTSLGEIPLDTEFIDKLLQNPIFKDISPAYVNEHSVMIQLPLLQRRLGDFKLVPIVAGQCSPQTIQQAASTLKSLVGKDTLVIASSDFTHYGPNYDYIPFTQNISDELKKLNMGAYDRIARLDGAGFLDYCDKTGATICGRVPIAILLAMLPPQTKVEMLKYTTSGELAGDFANSVSYLSVAFHGSWQQQSAAEPNKTAQQLTPQDKQNLLLLARKGIEFYLQHFEAPAISQLGVPVTDAMKVKRAAFVTLKNNSELRGCIGDILPRQPLYKSVVANAINAAINDWRFTPVTDKELDAIKIEISALTYPTAIDSYNKIRLGTDGVILNKNNQTALFLPQVAIEQNWTVEQMLSQLSRKARLPLDAWKEGANILIFQAEVFGEE